MTVDTDILYPALRLAGVLTAAGRLAPVNGSQMTDAFQTLNRMLDAWTTQRLLIWTIRVDRYTLTPSQVTYTIGPSGADFTAPRPVRISDASIVTTGGGSEIHLPLRLLTDHQWAAKRLRVMPTTIPTELYYDGAYPNATLYLWGYPTAGNDLELFTWQQLTQFVLQTDTVLFPPGYLDAVVYNLAVRLSGLFGTQLRGDVAQTAKEAKAAIKASNATSPTIPSADFGMRGRSGGDFNYLSGGPSK